MARVDARTPVPGWRPPAGPPRGPTDSLAECNLGAGRGASRARRSTLRLLATASLRHSRARVADGRRQAKMASTAGELVTETFAYDGGRAVTAYLPPEPPQAVVFAGDGQLIAQWGDFVAAAGGPPTMIVGVHRLADETLRLHEYSPGFDPERFAAHESVLRRGRARTGRGRASGSRCRGSAPRSSASRRAESWRWPSGFAIRTSTAPCSAPRRAGATGRPPCCRARCRAPTSSAGTRGALLLRERDPLGGRAARCRRGRGDDRTGRIAHGGAFWRAELPLMVTWAFGR